MLPVGQLQILGIGVEAAEDGQSESAESEEARSGQLSASELEKEQRWWRWLLLTGLFLLLVESVWASMIEKRQAEMAT